MVNPDAPFCASAENGDPNLGTTPRQSRILERLANVRRAFRARPDPNILRFLRDLITFSNAILRKTPMRLPPGQRKSFGSSISVPPVCTLRGPALSNMTHVCSFR
ncbi:MAG: hypothetical protein OEN48_05360 [Betaproteobacteria bacterium]|nr:hypothetical protein [Betaproteobacteria bacterium]